MGEGGFVSDVTSKFKEPLFALHFINFVLGIVAAAAMGGSTAPQYDPVSGNVTNSDACGFNFNSGACSFGKGIAVGALIFALLFLVVDFFWEKFEDRAKTIYMLQVGISGGITVAYAIAFFILIANWGPTPEKSAQVARGSATTAITTEFFNTLLWGIVAWMIYKAFHADGGEVHLNPFRAPASAYEDIGTVKAPAYHDPVTGASSAYQAPPSTVANI